MNYKLDHSKIYTLPIINKMGSLEKIYESYYYREIRNGRKPLSMDVYLKEREKGARKKDGTYKALSYDERLGYPKGFGKFLIGNKLSKKLLKEEILRLASRLDGENLTKGNRSFMEKRISILTEFL